MRTETRLPTKLPRHVGIIMDGNRRWATQAGMRPQQGHRQGAESVRAIIRTARELGIAALTLYAFSDRNWERPAEEVAALMGLLVEFLDQEEAELRAQGIRLVTIGERRRLPVAVRERLRAIEGRWPSERTPEMVLCLALSYGSRAAIAEAVRRLARATLRGALKPRDIGPEAVEQALSTRELPPLDLVIRTSGEQRLSDFLLWEAAYAELWFTRKPWPEFGRGDLLRALRDFARRHRRYGA